MKKFRDNLSEPGKNKSKQEDGSPALRSVRLDGYRIAQFAAVWRADQKLEILYGALPARDDRVLMHPFAWSKVKLESGEKLVRLWVENIYGIVRFRFGAVKGKVSPSYHALPPLAEESNPTAVKLLGIFIGQRLQPNLSIKAEIKRLIPEETPLLMEVENANNLLRVVPPPVRETLIDMSALVRNIRGIDPVTGVNVTTHVAEELQREVFQIAAETDESTIVSSVEQAV